MWQYSMGRAVIIGVVSKSSTDSETKCMYEDCKCKKNFLLLVPVAKFMEWIIKVTGIN